MFESVTRLTLFALYQFTVVLGIILFPLAIATRRVGVTLPVRRLIAATEAAYERTADEA
ncbi:hypothetical protein ACNS7O_14135 [Haloferacaceae archaeon DSL9]